MGGLGVLGGDGLGVRGEGWGWGVRGERWGGEFNRRGSRLSYT